MYRPPPAGGWILFYLHTSGQHSVKYMRSLLHDSDVFWRGVGTLAVLDRVDEAVSEFTERAEKILLDEVDHAVICGNKMCCVSVYIQCMIAGKHYQVRCFVKDDFNSLLRHHGNIQYVVAVQTYTLPGCFAAVYRSAQLVFGS